MPSFEVKHTNELKRWLVQELEPICDADPEVLSDYVLALLRHDASEGDLQNLLKEQLEDFLSEKTAAFVSKTMGALKSQSYLPTSMRPSFSQQAEASTSSKKRSAEDEGRHSPAKMHRMPEESTESDRIPRGPSSSREGKFDSRRDRNTKPPCRDFHLRGFCPRGDECRYDHTIPPMPEHGLNQMMNLPGVQAGQQQFPMQAMPNAQHPQFMMHGQQGGYPMGMQGPPGAWSANGNGGPIQQQGISGTPSGAGNGSEGGLDLGARLGPQAAASEVPLYDVAFRGNSRGGRGGSIGRGGARGTFEKRATSNTTLVIENVPVENLDLIKINEYFKKFGTITNIQIDVDSKKALVSYSQPGEAKAAHTSPEVIFNNRFVKVYFQKLDDPGIGVKPKEAASNRADATPPLKNNFIPGQTSNKFVRPDLASKSKEVQDAASQKLDALMAQQKEIMTKLTTPSTKAEEKKALMSQFGVLEKEIKAATEEVRLAVSNASNPSKDASPAPASEASSKWKEQREVKQREQLDRELEAHSTGGNGNTTEELKAQLARLQEEAASLGIDGESAAAGRGSFRGRVRGGFRGTTSRGFPSYNSRGRGGATRAIMSIDNRPTKLHVSEIPSEGKEKVKEHFKQFGDIHTIEDKDDGTLTIHYKARLGGERALRAGLGIPEIGEVKASWVVENPGKTEGNVGTTAESIGTADEAGDEEGDPDDRDDHFRR